MPSNTIGSVAKHPTLTALGERVRALRARRGLTRKTLAQEASVSERHLANLESGVGNASILILQLIAQALECSLAELLGDETTATPDWLLIRDTLQHKTNAQIKQAHAAVTALFDKPTDPAVKPKRHIALLGLRGAGKSTLGALLATALNRPFIELNRVVEQAAGCTVSEIHALYGAAAHRRYERRALNDVLEQQSSSVIATPGGLVSDPAALNVLLKQCTTVWLQASPQEHMSRVLAQGDKRPMRGNREAMSDLLRILQEREPFYAKADFACQTSGKTPSDIALELAKLVS